jgi:hypothetical protein
MRHSSNFGSFHSKIFSKSSAFIKLFQLTNTVAAETLINIVIIISNPPIFCFPRRHTCFAMYHCDYLLSPTPKGPSDITTLDDAAHDKQNVLDCIARGEIEEIRGAVPSRTSIISERYCSIGDGVDSLEGYLHSIWHIYYQLGRHTSHESAEHDRLVLDILRIQGLGPLTRPVTGRYGIHIARTIDGTLWNDLPYLVSDMTEFWINNCAIMSGVQRLNYASFLAKLASARVSKDRMCQVALTLFLSVFEERRELRSERKSDEEDRSRSIRDLDISQLLPAAFIWFKEAGCNIIQLSDVYWNDCPSEIGQGGPLFIDSEFGKRSPTGFTPWRWMYWLKRLHEIKEEIQEPGNSVLEKYATDAIEFMAETAKERNSGILKAYEDGGITFHAEKHLLCLRRSG